MNGSIRCCRCHSGIDERGDGTCPKCKKPKSYVIDFYWSYSLGGDGKHHKLRFGLDWTRTRSKLRTLRSQLDEGTFDPYEWGLITENPHTLAVYLKAWLVEVENDPARDPGTKEMYHTQVKRILATSQANVDLRRLETDDYKAMFAEMQGRNTTKGTTKKALSAFLTWARAKRHILSIPPLPQLKANDAKPKFVLTLLQQEEALCRLPAARRDLYASLMHIGGRVSEILCLQAADVNFAQKTVTLQRTWSADCIKESTKTGKPRTLPLTDTALEILQRAIGDKIGAACIWTRPDGTPYRLQKVEQEWKDKSGFPPCSAEGCDAAVLCYTVAERRCGPQHHSSPPGALKRHYHGTLSFGRRVLGQKCA